VTSELADAVAAYGVPTQHRLPPEPLSDDEFAQLLGECEHHRILGFLGTAVRDGAFPVTEDQRGRVDSTWQGWLSHAVRVERLLLDATNVLDRHDIRSIVLKGVALAHTAYPDPSTRVFGDVDLLVEPHNFTRAANALIAELGAERSLPELRRGFDDRFGKEILVVIRDVEFDLHRMFVEGPYGVAIELDDLWQTPEAFALGDRDLLALAPPARVVHAAYAAALGDWPLRLSALRDFIQTWSGNRARLEAATELARAWRCDAVVQVACERAQEVLGTEASGLQAPRRGRLPRRDRVFLASYRGTGRGYLRNLVAPIAVRGLGNKVRYVRSVAFPDPAYLAARGASRKGFARQAWAKVRADRGSR
jgi:hypothetical protein